MSMIVFPVYAALVSCVCVPQCELTLSPSLPIRIHKKKNFVKSESATISFHASARENNS